MQEKHKQENKFSYYQPSCSEDSWELAWRKKYIPRDQLSQFRQEQKALGKTLATLNGSFDLLHAGHLHILYEASKCADLLIVALNSDLSIQEYKSKDRPIIPLEARLKMMAAIECVDFITSFDELNPLEILKELQPDIHVNGSEYGSECIEADLVRSQGGKIKIVSLVPGLSTTEIIAKIQKLCV